MNGMGSGASMTPVWAVAGAIGLYVLLGMAIRRGNSRQRPILWAALILIAAIVLVPPWLGEKGEWINASDKPGHQDSRYVISKVSVGYAPVWCPPTPRLAYNNKPMEINWPRLFKQVGVVAVLACVVALALRTRPTVQEPEES